MSKIFQKAKIKLKGIDIHTKEVIKKSSASMVVKISGMIVGLLVSVFIGRTLGAEGLGIINLANRIVAVLLIFSMFGFQNVIIKNVAIALDKKDYGLIANSVRTSLLFNGLIAVLITIIVLYFSFAITEYFFKEPLLKIPLTIAVLMLVPQTLSRIYGAALNGMGKIWQSNLVNQTLSIWVVGIGLLLLYVFGYPISILNVIILYATGRIVVTACVFVYWKFIFNHKTQKRLLIKPMIKMASPLLLVSATAVIAANADVMMIGWLSNTKEVGLYSVAARLALLVSFFLQVSNSAIAPKLAAMYSNQKLTELRVLVKRVTSGLMIIAIFFLVIFIVLGKFMLGIWGVEFTEAYKILVILGIGQFFNISTGCSGMLLIMCGYEKIHGYISLTFVILNLILNYFLIINFGAVGAAIATAITITLENITKVTLAKQKTGIWTIPIK